MQNVGVNLLRPLCLEDMEQIREWRNEVLETLRTPIALTKEQQEDWYRREICDSNSRSRFFGITYKSTNLSGDYWVELIGYGGIENIQWENRIGEISLLIAPDHRKAGTGFNSAIEILNYAVDNLNLHTVYAECYCNNSAVNFWHKVFAQFPNYTEVVLPNRKYWGGMYVSSMYFSVSR